MEQKEESINEIEPTTETTEENGEQAKEEVKETNPKKDRFDVSEDYKNNPPTKIQYREDDVVKKNANKILTLDEKYQIMLGDNYKYMNRYKTKEGKWKFNPNIFNREKTYGFELRETFEEYREYQKKKSKTPSTKKVRFCLMENVKDIRAPPTEGKKKE
jgi:hypothetical protein